MNLNTNIKKTLGIIMKNVLPVKTLQHGWQIFLSNN